jgi:hypothetical protein
MPLSEAALRAEQKPEKQVGGIFPVRRAVPFQGWIEAAAKRVISAIEAVPAVKACHPAAAAAVQARGAAAVAAAGGEAEDSHENIPIINSDRFTGEDDDAFGNK